MTNKEQLLTTLTTIKEQVRDLFEDYIGDESDLTQVLDSLDDAI
jgi:hypothetical protein